MLSTCNTIKLKYWCNNVIRKLLMWIQGSFTAWKIKYHIIECIRIIIQNHVHVHVFVLHLCFIYQITFTCSCTYNVASDISDKVIVKIAVCMKFIRLSNWQGKCDLANLHPDSRTSIILILWSSTKFQGSKFKLQYIYLVLQTVIVHLLTQ